MIQLENTETSQKMSEQEKLSNIQRPNYILQPRNFHFYNLRMNSCNSDGFLVPFKYVMIHTVVVVTCYKSESNNESQSNWQLRLVVMYTENILVYTSPCVHISHSLNFQNVGIFVMITEQFLVFTKAMSHISDKRGVIVHY